MPPVDSEPLDADLITDFENYAADHTEEGHNATNRAVNAVAERVNQVTEFITAGAQAVAQAITRSQIQNSTSTEEDLLPLVVPADVAPGKTYTFPLAGAIGYSSAAPDGTNQNCILRLRCGASALAVSLTGANALPWIESANYQYDGEATLAVFEDKSLLTLRLRIYAPGSGMQPLIANLGGSTEITTVSAGDPLRWTFNPFSAYLYAIAYPTSLRQVNGPSGDRKLLNIGAVTRGGLAAQVSSPNRSWSLKQLAAGVDRFELRSGDYQQIDGNTKERVMLVRSNQPMPYDTDVWTAGSFYIEPGDPITADGSPGSYCLLAQAHRTFDEGDVITSPVLDINLLEDDDLVCNTRSDATDPGVSQPTPVERWRVPGIARSQWYHIVNRIRFSKTGTGHLTTWLNGTQIYTGNIPLGANDALGPYWSWGIYRNAASETLAVRWANVEGMTTTDLTARIATPLPIAD